ncbi:Uncharacterised protein [Bordetella pertussis]|nr:Uncharacterised protein [Bordetella pertussis]
MACTGGAPAPARIEARLSRNRSSARRSTAGGMSS